jgi:signal transduction histidine kinase
VSPEKFAGFAEKLGIRGDGVLTLVRDSGEIMARHPAIEKSLGQVLKDRPYHVVGAPDSGRFRQIGLVDGLERIYGYHRLPEYGITFVVGEAITDVLAPYESHFFTVIGGALAVSVLAMFLFFMLFRSLVDLEEVRQQLVAIFELSPDGFVSFDVRRVVMYASPAFIRMTGLEEAEIAGLDEDTFSERLLRRCAEHALFPGVAALRERQRSSAAGPVKRNRQLIEMAESSKRVLEVGIRLSESSQVSQILYFRDVTHETEIDRMKSEFLSHAAHELRTPMASIYGFSELLLEMELDEATRRDLLETIHRQTQQLVEIINELLDLARIEERRGKDFKVEAVNLATLVRETVTDLGFDAALWPVKLDLPDEEILVRADVAKLRQALINVLGNAQKYSPDGGELGVGLTSVRPGFAGIKVEDRGIGMSLEQLSHFGQRFWRADTSGKTPGTGLGLAIVKEIIALHGGDVEVSSVPNRGTTITLWLPASGALPANAHQ